MFDDYHMTPFETAKARQAAADLPDAERQAMVRGMLLRTPTFELTTRFLRAHHMPVTNGTHDRGRICGLLGPSRVGKSWGVNAYCDSLGMVDETKAIMPKAVYVDCKMGWSALVFAQAVADAANVSRKGRASAAAILEMVAEDVAAYGVELLVIDDAQWMFTARSNADIVKGFIIGLAERRCCNVVLVGTEPISLVVRAEGSMYGRGSFPTQRLEPSGWRDGGKPGEFHVALGMIDAMLPFRARSNLAHAWTAAHLYHLASGKLGLAMNVIGPAAQAAIEEGAASVTVDHLRAAARWIRLPDDPWEAFGSPINLDAPGTSESDFDLQDRTASDRVEEMLEEQRNPKPKPRARKASSDAKLTKKRG